MVNIFGKSKGSAQPRRRQLVSNGSSQSREVRDEELERQRVTYRRNRTLAGSTQVRLRAADKRAIDTATPREKTHHLSHLRRKVVMVLTAILVVSAVLLVVLQQYTAGVAIQFANSAVLPSNGGYDVTIQNYLNEHPMQRLRFNLDESKLNQFIVAKHPEVSNIQQLGFAGLAQTAFKVTLRKPVVSWQIDNRQYFVDEEGVSFERNVFDSPSVEIVDNSGAEYSPGKAIASSRFLGFVGRTVALSKKNGFEVTKVVLPPGTARQVQLSVKGVTYPVLMSVDRSPGEQVEDMIRAINYFRSQNRTPQYVDVRVKGKAFYRE